MKKNIILFIIVTFIFTACSYTNGEESVYQAPLVEGTKYIDPTFDEFVSLTSNAVVAKVLNIDEFDGPQNIIRLEIESNVIGEISDREIDYYTDNQSFEVGKRYILFLEFFDSAYYDNRVYSSLMHGEIDEKDNIVKYWYTVEEKAVDFKNVKSIEKHIESMSFPQANKSFGVQPFYKGVDVLGLVDISEYICTVKPVEVILETPVLVYYKAKVTKKYKGDLKEDIIIILPSGTEVEKKYVVFLNEQSEGTYELNSSEGIVSVDEFEVYDKVVKKLDKLEKSN